MHDHPHHEHDHGPHFGQHYHPPARGNNSLGAKQWQTPHLPEQTSAAPPPEQADLDLVETAFVDAFPGAADPVSFLRLAGVAFEGGTADGQKLVLLRVEVQDVTDVGAVMPHLGGAGFRYDPLPGKLTSNRKRLAFVYFDGISVRSLSLQQAQALRPLAEEKRL